MLTRLCFYKGHSESGQVAKILSRNNEIRKGV